MMQMGLKKAYLSWKSYLIDLVTVTPALPSTCAQHPLLHLRQANSMADLDRASSAMAMLSLRTRLKNSRF